MTGSPGVRWITVRRTLRRLALGLVGVLVAGNLTILAAFGATRLSEPEPELAIEGIHNVRMVDAKLWRGDAPSAEGYRGLAEREVTTVVDLRAERDLDVPTDLLDEVGIEWVHIPIRDGQTPAAGQAARFVDVVREADGLVYVHCGAGVGRAGAMAATYLVEEGETSSWEALGRNLAVGPPSFEQIVYAASLQDDHQPEQPSAWVEGVSRVFDGPRRIWSVLRS